MKQLIIFSIMVSVHGLPATEMDGYQYYNEQEYQEEYDYDDDILVNDVDDATIPSHRPSIISDSVVLDVDNGMTIRLPCSVDKLPDGIQILWSRDDSAGTVIAMGTLVIAPEYKDRATVVMTEAGSTLTIGIAKAEDAGLYKCSVAVRGDQPELKHQVRIRVPPTIESSALSVVEVEQGDTVRLDCSASGSPPPSVTWTRLGRPLPDGSLQLDSDTVIFSQASRQHAGTYQCTATNGPGREASKLVELEVRHPPEIELGQIFVSSFTGQDEVELVCNVHANPAPKVVWTKDGGDIKEERRVHIKVVGRRHSLVISRVQQADFGQYSCSATNRLGQAEKTIGLSGLAAPVQFKSSADGDSEDSFLLEWTSLSYSPISTFRLEVAEATSGSWKSYTVTGVEKEGPYHWAGKMFLSKLSPATQYKARASAQNELGWSQAGHEWSFATLGAVPSPSSVTRSGATSLSFSTASILFLIAVGLIRD